MTVIAWDGTTLAADRRACTGGAHYSVCKVRRVGDALVGVSGTGDRIEQFVAWLAAGAIVADYPVLPEDVSLHMLVVRPGQVLRYERTPWPITVLDATAALGSGADYARAAMHLGCCATRAVEVASALDESCGNGVDTLTFASPAGPAR